MSESLTHDTGQDALFDAALLGGDSETAPPLDLSAPIPMPKKGDPIGDGRPGFVTSVAQAEALWRERNTRRELELQKTEQAQAVDPLKAHQEIESARRALDPTGELGAKKERLAQSPQADAERYGQKPPDLRPSSEPHIPNDTIAWQREVGERNLSELPVPANPEEAPQPWLDDNEKARLDSGRTFQEEPPAN